MIGSIRSAPTNCVMAAAAKISIGAYVLQMKPNTIGPSMTPASSNEPYTPTTVPYDSLGATSGVREKSSMELAASPTDTTSEATTSCDEFPTKKNRRNATEVKQDPSRTMRLLPNLSEAQPSIGMAINCAADVALMSTPTSNVDI